LPEFPAGVKDPLVGPPLPPPSGAKYNENLVCSPQYGHIGGYDGPLFQWVTRVNSLLGGSIEYQWNFAANQRIQTAYQSKNNGVCRGRENWRNCPLACDRDLAFTPVAGSRARSDNVISVWAL
jgi:hypothetical protein